MPRESSASLGRPKTEAHAQTVECMDGSLKKPVLNSGTGTIGRDDSARNDRFKFGGEVVDGTLGSTLVIICVSPGYLLIGRRNVLQTGRICFRVIFFKW